MFSEKVLFSEMKNESKKWMEAIEKGSRSSADASRRVQQYEALFSQYEGLRQEVKMFSTSYADNNLMLNQMFDATVTSNSKSIVGYFAVEQTLTAPNDILYFEDIYDVATSTKVLANIGRDNLGTTGKYKNKVTQTAVALIQNNTVLLAKKLVPGTINIQLTTGGVTYEVIDNKKGLLIGPGNLLAVGTVNYTTGALAFNLIAAPTATPVYSLTAIEDQAGTENINRFKDQWGEYYIKTLPEMLVMETNLINLAVRSKATGIAAEDRVFARMTELYTKILNKGVAEEIDRNYTGNSVAIPNTATFSDFRSTLDEFSTNLVEVDKALAHKSYKGLKATAYLVGEDVAAKMRKLKTIGVFREEDQNYINDLIGYVNDTPVILHDAIAAGTGYAVHKTAGGELAPIGRGMFLPLTNTPGVGNFKNPAEYAQGVYYQESSDLIVPELVQKFTI